MNKQQAIPYGLLYAIAPEHFADLLLGRDVIRDEFDWDESENQYESETLASDVLGFFNKPKSA